MSLNYSERYYSDARLRQTKKLARALLNAARNQNYSLCLLLLEGIIPNSLLLSVGKEHIIVKDHYKPWESPREWLSDALETILPPNLSEDDSKSLQRCLDEFLEKANFPTKMPKKTLLLRSLVEAKGSWISVRRQMTNANQLAKIGLIEIDTKSEEARINPLILDQLLGKTKDWGQIE